MSSSTVPRDLVREWSEKKDKPHTSIDEKYDMLVLRDKIIRANRKMSETENNSEVADDEDLVITGICPEICPEKERYERIKQGRVDSFEKQTRMIKDFSRQAADQDMPLPSELRTPAALLTTMNFLLREMMTESPVGWESPSGWYDFVWRRVRAIRKEITQQRLTGPVIAGILEAMCRFHIIAFHMFCETDQNQFAPKLNLENLNDCLATLERIYAGMAAEGHFSANVAEFRAYEMILRVFTDKLDLVKTTAQVEKLPLQVRNSPELKFARRVISAVNNNFFSEFRQLFSAADYVTACLMHYHLPMLQAKALDFLATASGTRAKSANTKNSDKNSSTKISSDFFSQILGLETIEDLDRFTKFHGLLFEPDSGRVFFPSGFSRSRDPKMYPRRRSTFLVQSKSAGRSLAEIVAKRQLAEIPIPDVVEIDSFDQRGFFVGENPFTVSFEKENFGLGKIEGNRQKKDSSAETQSSDARSIKVDLPVLSIPRSPFPSPRPIYTTNSSPRFPKSDFVFQTISSSEYSPRFSPPDPSLPPVPSSPNLTRSSPDRKRTRAASFDDNDNDGGSGGATGPTESKRIHQEIPSSPSPVKVAPLVFNQTVPPSPGPSLHSPKSISEKKNSEKISSNLQEEETTETTERFENEFPLRTNLQIIRARTVCQAGGLLGCVFRAWRTHATRHRRPSRFFGQIDASPEQKERAERVRVEEIRRLIWTKFPFRSTILTGDTFDVCTLLFFYAAQDKFCQMEEWLRTKLGDPEPIAPDSIRIVTYKQGDKMLRIVFARVFDEDNGIVSDVTREIEPAGPEISGVILYALDRYGLFAAKDLLNRSKVEMKIPIVLFCHDENVSRFDMENDLSGNLLLDVFVAEISPSLELSGVLWDAILTLIERRLTIPVRKNSTFLRLLSELYCNFLRIFRTLKVEIGAGVVERQTAVIWNSLVDDYFAEESVEISFDAEKCCDKLIEIIQSNKLCSFLKLDESSLWETPGRFPEIFPIGSADEVSDSEQSSYEIWAAISEKVVTLSAMAAVCDPVVWQNPKFLPDFELELRDWLEKLDDDRSERGEDENDQRKEENDRREEENDQREEKNDRKKNSSALSSSASFTTFEDRLDADSGSHQFQGFGGVANAKTDWGSDSAGRKVDKELLNFVKKDTKNLKKWFDKISSDFSKLDSL